MRTEKVLKPKPTWDGHLQLDTRIVSLQGRELADLIDSSVERTQKPFMQPLPDQLVVTQQQFASLNGFLEPMADPEYRLYMTPWNVMEVIVDREHVDDNVIVQDTFDLIDEINEQEQKREQGNTQIDDHTDPRSIPGRNDNRRPGEDGKRPARFD